MPIDLCSWNRKSWVAPLAIRIITMPIGIVMMTKAAVTQ
jgi:hypothetical protein